MRLLACALIISIEPGLALAQPAFPAPRLDRDIQPLEPPRPVYPPVAVNRGLTGKCEVSLDVTPQGKPFNVVADCTHEVFVASATEAMKAVTFPPKIVDGQVVVRTGVVYPIEYRME